MPFRAAAATLADAGRLASLTRVGLQWERSDRPGQADAGRSSTAPAAPSSGDQPGWASEVLRLQRSAGNAAVAATLTQRSTRSRVPVQRDMQWTPGQSHPALNQDHGFLDDGHGNLDPTKMEQGPTPEDVDSAAMWTQTLWAAQLLRPDLPDATRMYEHYLNGSGTPLTVDYERYLKEDPAGQDEHLGIISDAREGARKMDDAWMADHQGQEPTDHEFDMTSEPVDVGQSALYHYPQTENWQKTIGAHKIYVSAHVRVTVDKAADKRHFEIDLTVHMEDRYNFNPGGKDMKTKIPDSDNGRFQVTGLAKEFDVTGTAHIQIQDTMPLSSSPQSNMSNVKVGVTGLQSPPPQASDRTDPVTAR